MLMKADKDLSKYHQIEKQHVLMFPRVKTDKATNCHSHPSTPMLPVTHKTPDNNSKSLGTSMERKSRQEMPMEKPPPLIININRAAAAAGRKLDTIYEDRDQIAMIAAAGSCQEPNRPNEDLPGSLKSKLILEVDDSNSNNASSSSSHM